MSRPHPDEYADGEYLKFEGDYVTSFDPGLNSEDIAPLRWQCRDMWSRCGRLLPIDLLFDPLKGPPTPVGLVSDGSTASYYELPLGAAELQDLISYKNMNSQIGEIFRTGYRYGESSHSDCLRDAKKIKFYIEAEIARLEKRV